MVAVYEKFGGDMLFLLVVNHVDRAVSLNDEEQETFRLTLLYHHFFWTGEQSWHEAVDCTDKDHVIDIVVAV